MKRSYTVVENAGYKGERDVITFPKENDAIGWAVINYTEDEIAILRIQIATNFEDGTRSY